MDSSKIQTPVQVHPTIDQRYFSEKRQCCQRGQADDNRAGPFANVGGNDTSKITLSNSSEPIDVSGSLSLTFRSYSKTFNVSKWWWLDGSGKRQGDKHKG